MFCTVLSVQQEQGKRHAAACTDVQGLQQGISASICPGRS